MATEKWVAGAVSAWTAAYTSAATFNSIVSGNAILGDLVLDNTTNLDMFAAFSFQGGSVTTVAPAYIGLYLYPLNDDASTYGDGRFGTSAAGPPPSSYYVGNFVFPVGTQALKGVIPPFPIGPLKYKPVLYNQAGVTLAGSGANTLKWATFNRSVA